MGKSTKPKSATSYKDTAFGIIPKAKVVELEREGIKKALQYIIQLGEKKVKITPDKKEPEGFLLGLTTIRLLPNAFLISLSDKIMQVV